MYSSKITKFSKTYLLYPLLGILFLFAATAAIFYARGYHYDFKAGKLVKTGIILVNSSPSQAQVMFGTRVLRNGTSTKIANLLPGTYHLTLTKPGYQSWQKDLPVKAERVTFAQYPVLVPVQLKPRRMASDQSIGQLVSSPNGSSFLYSTTDGSQLWRVGSDGSNRRELFPIASQGSTLATPDSQVVLNIVSWAPDSSRALVQKTQSGVTSFWIVSDTISTLADLLPTDATNLQFNPADTNQLYFVRSGDLFRLNISSRTISSPLLEGVSAYDITRSQVFTIRTVKDKVGVWQSNADGTSASLVRQLAPGGYSLAYSPNGSSSIVLGAKQTTVYTKNTSGHLVKVTLDGGYVAAEWSKDGRRVMFWRADRVESYDLDLEQGFTVTTRVGLSSVHFSPDGYHVIVCDGTQSSWVEFDGANPVTLQDIIPQTLTYVQAHHSLYYVTIDNRLMSLSLRSG